MLFLLSTAFAADPTLFPLTIDPVVGDSLARVGVLGNAATAGSADATGIAELAIASRVAVQVRVGAAVEAVAPILGIEARGEILDEATSGIGLAGAVRYQRVGFDGEDGEVEATLAAARQLGTVRLLANITGGKDLAQDEGDVEASVALLRSLGSVVSIGADTRGRMAVGRAGEEHADAERRGWDVRAGALLAAGKDRFSGYAFGGAEVVGVKSESTAGGLVGLGLQVTF